MNCMEKIAKELDGLYYTAATTVEKRISRILIDEGLLSAVGGQYVMGSKMQYIVLLGDILGAFTFHGPFEDQEHANQWASVNAGNQQVHIFPMYP